MGKPKSTLKRVFIDNAKAAHKCKRCKDHSISKGTSRLNIKEGRSISRYCLLCAKVSLLADLESLQKLLGEVNNKNSIPG